MASKKITAMPDLAGGQVPTDLATLVDLSASLANQNVKSTLNDLFAEITKNITDLSVQFGNGAAATVSAAGKGKLIYNNSVTGFQVSANGGAYTSLLTGSGTAQQVAFFTAAAALGGDTAFVWDSTNNRLGIGVTVAASVTSLNVRADGSAIAAEFLPNTVSDNPRVQIQVTSSDGRIGTSNATPSPFYIITNNTERISVESGGAVAINRTSPAQAQLHVDAATNVTTAFLANNAAGSSVEIAIFQVNGGNRALLTENGEWILGNASSVSGKLTLANASGSTLTSISAGNAASTLNYIFPATDPTAGQFLQAAAPSGGNVTLSWATGSGSTSPAGADTQVQFNASGVFGASANLTWVSPTLTIGAATSATGLLTLANASGSTTTSIQAGNAAASLVYIFPTVSPTSGQVLTASAPSGANVTLSWATPTTGTVTGTGTATRVAFWSSASALSSNAALFWDNTNSRLGIGTAAPDLPLDVVSDATALAQQWRETGAGTCRVQLQVPSSFGQFGTSSNHAMGFIANGVQYVNIEPTGGTVFGSIIPATATVLINALANTDTALIANNASGSTISIASFQVGGSLRHQFLSTGEAIIGLASTVTGKLTLANSAGATLTSISAGNAASTLNFIWPVVDPTAGQVLSAAAPSGGNVVLSWTSAGGGGTPASPTNSIQYNNAGSFGGNAGLLYTPGSTTGDEVALATATITTGNAFSIALTGTAAASNTKTGLNIASSGANATASQTVYGIRSSVTNTGTTNTNIAALFTATGATTNWAASLIGAELVTLNSLGVTATDGLVLINNTAAAAGAQQYSPRIRFTGQGWRTTVTAASRTVDWAIDLQPAEGTTNPANRLVFSQQVNGGGFASHSVFGIDQGGVTYASFPGGGETGWPGLTVGLNFGTQASPNISGLFQNAGGSWFIARPVNNFGAHGTGMAVLSGGQFTWSTNSSSLPTGTLDTGLARAAAGVVRVTNASTGAGKLMAAQNGTTAQGFVHGEPDNTSFPCFYGNLPSGSTQNIFTGSNNNNVRVIISSGGKITGSLNNTSQNYRMEGQITTSVSDLSNTSTTPTTLFTATLPANSVSATGDCLQLEVDGVYANNANNKTVRVLLGATQLFSTGINAFANSRWKIRALIYRTGSAAQRAIVQYFSDDVLTIAQPIQYGVYSEDWTTSLAVSIEATGGATNDVTENTAILSISPG